MTGAKFSEGTRLRGRLDLPEHQTQRQELEFYLYLKYNEKFLQGLSSRAA